MNWKMLVIALLPMLELAGEAKKAEDSNETGKDDAIGESMVYVSRLLKAIVFNKTLPKAPDVLR